MSATRPCPSCKAPVPVDSRFCDACGSLVPKAVEAESAALHSALSLVSQDGRTAICPGCGIIAPLENEEGDGCPSCGTSLASPLRVSAPRDGTYWVGVQCQFQCRSCGHLSPLNHLDTDGSVECRRCGLDQAFDVSQWKYGIHHAHDVGDLAGPNPEGRHPNPTISIAADNPFANVGRTDSAVEFQQAGLVLTGGMMVPRALHIAAGPGHPLCERCSRPLQGRLTGPGELKLECESCGFSATTALPDVRPELPPGLVGVFAPDHRTDQAPVKVEGDAGAIAIKCPSCAAPLEVDGSTRIVTCGHCHTSSRIPSRTLLRLAVEPPKSDLWWLLFKGASDKRHELEEPHGPSAKRSDASLERSTSGRKIIETPPELRGVNVARILLGLLVPLMVTVLVGYVGFAPLIKKWFE